jgi:DNA-binding response OmpR family regulator
LRPDRTLAGTDIRVLATDASVMDPVVRRLAGLGLSVTAWSSGPDPRSLPPMLLLVPDRAGSCEWLQVFRRAGGICAVLGLCPSTRGAALLQAGADAVLPLDACDRELLATLGAVARRVLPAGPGADQPGPDSAMAATTRGLKLTPTEQRILELLARRRGRVVTRELIVDTLYPGADAPRSTTVDVFVHGLRRKLGGCEAGVRIETVRGAGFRLADA